MAEDRLQLEFWQWLSSSGPIAIDTSIQAQFDELDTVMKEFGEMKEKSSKEFHAKLKELKPTNLSDMGNTMDTAIELCDKIMKTAVTFNGLNLVENIND